MAKPILWKPHDYQITAVEWLLNHDHAALHLSPGLGKSAIALAAFQRMVEFNEAGSALIIAPLRVCQMVWTAQHGGEVGKWKQFADLRVTLLHGPKKDQRLEEDADLYVINCDGVKWLCAEGRLRGLCACGVDTLIVDEVSKFKHPNTARFKALKKHLPLFDRRWTLTGSPAPNGLLDLFGQVYIADQGAALGKYITYYRQEYFTPTGYGGYTWVLQHDGAERIYTALGDLAISMKAEDHLDLPKLIEQDLFVELPPQARKTYDAMEDDLLAMVGDNVITAANAAVASAKCRQVASGGVYADLAEYDPNVEIKPRSSKREVHQIHTAKTEALVDLVDELQGSPLLVAYEFQHDLERIRKALGKNTPAINGKTTAKQGIKLVADWNAGKLPVLCGHPAAMAHGLNLQASGNHICWYSITWDCELYDQLIRRIWRQGSKAKRVIVHRIVAKKTVDEVIIKTLEKKQRTQGALIAALKAYKKDR